MNMNWLVFIRIEQNSQTKILIKFGHYSRRWVEKGISRDYGVPSSPADSIVPSCVSFSSNLQQPPVRLLALPEKSR
jgi:hypothetical protein